MKYVKTFEQFINEKKEFKDLELNKGDKITIDVGNGPEDVEVKSDFKAGLNKIKFITLSRKSGAPYTFTLNKIKDIIVESNINEKIDTKYWAAYNDDDPSSPKKFSYKSEDFEDTFEDAIVEWNHEADKDNMIKINDIKSIRKVAEEFFKIEKWISINVIHAMIAQEM